MKSLCIKVLSILLFVSCQFQTKANDKTPRVTSAFTLTSFSPMSAKAGDTVYITGTGFSGITSVRFGGVPALTFEVNSSTLITAYVGPGASGNVYVAAGAAVDSLSGFSYETISTIVNFISPGQGYLGDTIYFHGQNFTDITRIDWGGVDASYTVLSDTLMMARVAGWAPVIQIYKTVGRMMYLTMFNGFTFLDSTAPVILSFTPDTAYVTQTVTIRGRGFTNTTKVQFGTAQESPFTVVSDSVITANPAPGSSAGNIYVTTDKGTASKGGFNYINYLPLVVSSFSPDSAKRGEVVTIRGFHLIDVDGVYFGGTPARSFTRVSDSLVMAVVGEGSSGNVVLTGTWNGTDSLSGFKYIDLGPLPVILSITPDNGPEGSPVRISGHHFSNATTVVFGGIQADSFKIISDSVIDTHIGTCCSGAVDVINTAGTGSMYGFTLNYPPPPPQDTTYTILNFAVTNDNGNALVTWQIKTDAGITAFVLQRAPDSLNFKALDSVAPINNWGTNDYSITDRHMLNGLNNYRLAVTDTLGNIRYSVIITVIHTSGNSGNNTIKLFPNPTNGNITIDHPSIAGQSSVTIMDMMGKKLMTIDVPANTTETKISLSRNYQGLYRVVWTDGKKSISRNLLIQSR